jgi:polyisoprenoid-binding protein YceI
MRFLALTVAVATIFTVACEDPAANKPKALTEAASNSTSGVDKTVAGNAVKGDSLIINPENSKVGFIGSKVTGKHDGGFGRFTGTIDLVNAKPEDSTVSVDIEMASVYTDADMLTEHLQTSDFFEVQKYPRSTFVSTKILPDTAKGPNSYMVTGDLEMRGVKKSVTFPATITVGDSEVAVNAEFAINRKDFGILFAGKKMT